MIYSVYPSKDMHNCPGDLTNTIHSYHMDILVSSLTLNNKIEISSISILRRI